MIIAATASIIVAAAAAVVVVVVVITVIPISVPGWIVIEITGERSPFLSAAEYLGLNLCVVVAPLATYSLSCLS